MSSINTTYLSAYQVPSFQVQELNLTFQLHPNRTRVLSQMQLERNAACTLAQPNLELDGQGLKLISIQIDGQTLAADAYEITAEKLLILAPPAKFTLNIEVEINPQANTYLEGLYISQNNFFTQCEAEGFRRITYYPDRPDVLSRFTCRIEADRAAYPVLLSNGNLIEAGNLDASRHFAVWEDPFPKPAYLFALVAGQLEVVKSSFTTASGRQVALELWVEKQNLAKCDYALESLKNAMRWDEENYQREYDLDTYMLVAVDDFNMGAMENKGLNIFNSACVLAERHSSTDFDFHQVESIIAHEYLHNWSGNRVTLRDWFQLSLKEGFTVLRDQEFSASQNSAALERIQQVNHLRNVQFAEDAGPTAHPVRPASYIEINNFYTLTIYEKGAEIMRMLRELLGQEIFRQGANLYFARHDGQAVTLEDFMRCMEKVSGRDLTQFMLWYSQAGTPILTATTKYDAAAQTLQLTLSQQTLPTPGQADKVPVVIPVKMGLLNSKGTSLDLVMQGENLGQETLLELTTAQATFVFENLAEQPVLSLLREFSAPVKVQSQLTKADLSLLMTSDPDAFNRWDAGQSLALIALQDLIQQLENQPTSQLDAALIQAYQQLVSAPVTDAALLAQMLKLPSEDYLAQQTQQIDIDLIHRARNLARVQIAQALEADFWHIYAQMQQPWAADGAARAARSLKNTCLEWLLIAGSPKAIAAAQTQFEQADNMTDRLASLQGLVHCAAPEASAAALEFFAQLGAQDPLIMDRWFSVQASNPQAGTLHKVKELLQHPAFNLANPNKVRALIGNFTNNRVNFHALDGQGYAWVAQQLLELNSINPQIAARLVIPLTRFARLDTQRQQLMQAELKKLAATPNLSADLYEQLSRALASC